MNNNIETITIWKRDFDNRYSVCILEDGEDGYDGRVLLQRTKQTFNTLEELLYFVITICGSELISKERIEAFHAGYHSNDLPKECSHPFTIDINTVGPPYIRKRCKVCGKNL